MADVEVPFLPPPTADFQQERFVSPRIVQVLDKVRFELSDKYPGGEMDEVAWFCREYPRAYRYHLACADFRLETISSLYQELHRELVAEVCKNPDVFEASKGNRRVQRIYWDFESFLSEIAISLDLMARIVGVAYKNEMPPSFTRFCRKPIEGDEISDSFMAAKVKWVDSLKDYRDCFVHYTPVDTQLSIRLVRRTAGWETRCKLPSNPNERDITRFRFPLRLELLRYALTVRRHMHSLDKTIAKHIEVAYMAGIFPARTSSLLLVGRRDRSSLGKSSRSEWSM